MKKVQPHWGYLAGAAIGAGFTLAARRPPSKTNPLLLPGFFGGWLTNELVFHHYLWQTLASVGWIRAGALRHPAGWAALGLTAAQWAAMGQIVREVRATRSTVEDALIAGLGPDYRDALPNDASADDFDLVDPRSLLVPFRPQRHGVERLPNRVFAHHGGEDLRLDITQAVATLAGDRRPCLVYVHGGGWMTRNREHQGIPLMAELASRGWVCIRADYRLSPRHAFPAHLIDVKRAIAWVREHADELGVDPDQIAIAGGSAGGHLAALAALTPNRPELQPGFEDIDTSVFAAVPIYGVFDFRNRLGLRNTLEVQFLARTMFKQRYDDRGEVFHLASPMDQVHPDAPAFLVLHGQRDSLAPAADATHFAALLREAGARTVVDVELPGAQHAFDIFPSWRTLVTLRGVARFLEFARATRPGSAAPS